MSVLLLLALIIILKDFDFKKEFQLIQDLFTKENRKESIIEIIGITTCMIGIIYGCGFAGLAYRP